MNPIFERLQTLCDQALQNALTDQHESDYQRCFFSELEKHEAGLSGADWLILLYQLLSLPPVLSKTVDNDRSNIKAVPSTMRHATSDTSTEHTPIAASTAPQEASTTLSAETGHSSTEKMAIPPTATSNTANQLRRNKPLLLSETLLMLAVCLLSIHNLMPSSSVLPIAATAVIVLCQLSIFWTYLDTK